MEERRPLRLVVVGNGMVSHRFLELVATSAAQEVGPAFEVTVVAEEPRLAYDRVGLSSFFDGRTPEEMTLPAPGQYQAAGFTVRLNARATGLDRARRVVTAQTPGGVQQLPYDRLVLATGSSAFVPPIPGRDAPGCFVYRTIEDLEAIRAWSAAREGGVGAVIGGGLLGLEAAYALQKLGMKVHVIEFAPRLMALQLDETGGAVLRRRIEDLGVEVHTATSTKEIIAHNRDPGDDGRVRALRFANGDELDVDLLVFSAGIRPRDELARAAGLPVGERGGIVIDQSCRTEDPAIYAIGECASYEGRCYGLVAPGYQMARAAAAALCHAGASEAADAVFTGFDMSTKLKLMGVDVASFGDAFGAHKGAHVVSLLDTSAALYKKLVLSPDRKHLLGGMLVGDASAYGQLLQLAQNQVVLPPEPETLILPAGGGEKERPAGMGVTSLPDAAQICSCNNVSKGEICDAIRAQKLTAVGAVKSCTKAGTTCGSCVPLVTDLLKAELKMAGVAVSNHLCEHFPHSRQELYSLVRFHQHQTFEALLAQHGRGRGCEICKPAVASILASAWNEHVLKPKHRPLQDTNDRYMANIQRDGTYSVVPRVAGGEITPAGLVAIGQIAGKYGLYTKITGGQRIDMFGAQLEQLPHIWRELVDAGFESGHAYGKALRTVKSCVGSTWCRYGVQDSVSLAIRIENRYKGLRAPHKLKSAVSGCARECAEAQGKDFGVIATEKGYNLYLCGNGGMKPQHAQLFATDLDEATLIKYVDRFLMFYVRTADRLQRTATWLNNLEGGLDYLKSVIVDDALGICAELEAEMAHVVDTYACEWKAALEDGETLRQFRAFVNTDAADPSIINIAERGQHRPATWSEKASRVGGAGLGPAEPVAGGSGNPSRVPASDSSPALVVAAGGG
ncbi:MAG TPA: nitrite reductase large subunit NirB [Polyangia bacterium]|jgi:nitrite reductase (NADH) large subunit